MSDLKIAVLIPCYNEEVAIAQVVSEFKSYLPEAQIYVYDNNSSDGTVDSARRAGAIVRSETMQGKGHVVRRMFSDIEADYYVLVDGDATYETAAARRMVERASSEGLDMVNGVRVTDRTAAYRPGHVLGNKMLTGLVMSIFGRRTTDLLSGYRVFSRRFVKSFPVMSAGFEIETEFSVHALELNMPIAEEPTLYVERPVGSTSKLNTYQDGFRILLTILMLVQREKPVLFYFSSGLALFVVGLLVGAPVVLEYTRTGLVPRLPSAVLATGLVILSALCILCGIVMNGIKHGRQEMKRLSYLSYAIRIEQ
ncbi:glycosyl transferase family 2 [Gluconobacter thailandicus F149-1 = NBRC 100600]|uniref:Glycosyltransferase n=1 Tax=Gluconobacter thailandicus NBRC 3257 TaxID=1381097 RepID=A0ABQ0IYP0_GLUTH|nr:glycosyltransferase family 2 protein [Gluconobacter thailandicus]KXV52499.1 glycosyl transferase family 2 [Gluconobacter thailandicus]GAC87153.1 glycosyltransferase [Gluconobacter thailandicus NBRC 3255]GAD27326.1 glycosyltransferase [Gluconobacter thailandicus NBRC 3257]GAN92606.1 glycosyl transferase family 2 [Gluconobacter thailandicus F149-1 = NBRC 100600]GBR60922.1 glycosyltransferase [Gluconobacter thailandicus F149-1 = NBRC 100600]